MQQYVNHKFLFNKPTTQTRAFSYRGVYVVNFNNKMATASVSVTGGAYDQESTEVTLEIDLLYSCLSINLKGFLVAK